MRDRVARGVVAKPQRVGGRQRGDGEFGSLERTAKVGGEPAAGGGGVPCGGGDVPWGDVPWGGPQQGP